MAKSGFQPQPVSFPIQNSRQPIAYAKPQTTSFRIEDGLGMAMTGMGPAVGGNVNPVFLPPQNLPKFPVEPQERIVPVQVKQFKT